MISSGCARCRHLTDAGGYGFYWCDGPHQGEEMSGLLGEIITRYKGHKLMGRVDMPGLARVFLRWWVTCEIITTENIEQGYRKAVREALGRRWMRKDVLDEMIERTKRENR